MLETAFTRLIGCRVPLQLAGMPGVTTPALVAAVANAGGLGMLGAGRLPPPALAAVLHDRRRRREFPPAVSRSGVRGRRRSPRARRRVLLRRARSGPRRARARGRRARELAGGLARGGTGSGARGVRPDRGPGQRGGRARARAYRASAPARRRPRRRSRAGGGRRRHRHRPRHGGRARRRGRRRAARHALRRRRGVGGAPGVPGGSPRGPRRRHRAHRGVLGHVAARAAPRAALVHRRRRGVPRRGHRHVPPGRRGAATAALCGALPAARHDRGDPRHGALRWGVGERSASHRAGGRHRRGARIGRRGPPRPPLLDASAAARYGGAVAGFAHDEIEAAFRTYWRTGAVAEDWEAWCDLFTEDCLYVEHSYGTMLGREAVRRWIVPLMERYGEIYTVYEWHVIDAERGRAVVARRTRRDDPGGEGASDLPGGAILDYAGCGRGKLAEDFYSAA